jgi:phospholipid transport system substrate-binding protein
MQLMIRDLEAGYGPAMMRGSRVDHLLVMLAALSFFVVRGGAAAVNDSSKSPEQLVRVTTDEMLGALRSHRDAISKDPRQLVSLMEQIIASHFGIRIMAREAFGKYWRRASEAQRNRFTNAFRHLLIDNYAAVFQKHGNQSIELWSVHAGSRKRWL